MSLFNRGQLPPTVLPLAAVSAPQQPGSFAQLLAFSGRAFEAHSPQNTIAFAQTDGRTILLPIADMQTMRDVSGAHYLVGSFCVPLHKDFISGIHPEWAYAMPIPNSAIASGGFVL